MVFVFETKQYYVTDCFTDVGSYCPKEMQRKTAWLQSFSPFA